MFGGVKMLRKEKFMDIYTLHRQGMKINAIAKKLGINWRTVRKYIKNGFTQKPYDASIRTSQMEEYIPIIHGWLENDAYTATWIYDRLRQMGYRGGYDQVKRKVRTIKEQLTLKAYVRFETEPGRQAQVDFGEFQVVDEFGNKVATVYLFAMILGYSRKPYFEFIGKRDMTNFLECHIRAFEHFGGVPTEILYDRMKNVLIRELAGKLEWNSEFYGFCLHYRFKPMVAPPYAAWVKGKIERPMNYVRENFWRGYSYRDIETANRDILEWSLTRESRVHGTTHERIDVRFDREKPLLGSLPEHGYDTSQKAFRKVHKDCTISFEGNVFVLPHRSVCQNALLKIKNGLLSAYLDDELLVTYEIPAGKGNFVQDPRFYQELKADIVQIRRKYRRNGANKGKAKKTLGITSGCASTVRVSVRSIDDYVRIAEG
jgi:transposase